MVTAATRIGTQSLDDLIAAAQADPSDNSLAMNEIVRRFMRLAARIAYCLTDRTSIHEDLSQAALAEIVKAVRRHKPARAGFSRYVYRYMLGGALRELKVWRPNIECDSLSDPETLAAVHALIAPMAEPGIYSWGYGAAGRAVRVLSEGQQELLTARYINDATLAEIAAETHTSIPAVSQRLATAHRAVARLIA